MKPQTVFIALAITLLSFVLAILGACHISGDVGVMVLVIGAFVNLLIHFPFLDEYPTGVRFAFLAIPLAVVTLAYGLCIIGWSYGALYALGALAVYMIFGAMTL